MENVYHSSTRPPESDAQRLARQDREATQAYIAGKRTATRSSRMQAEHEDWLLSQGRSIKS